jgi:DNA repair protein RecN (Recombination protein N)
VAATAGQLVRTLATHRQVLCVTHLPQVAACADTHFSVAKLGDDCSVRTTVVTLGHEQRIEEIARMLAGSEITARARAHAADLLEQPQRRGAAGNPRGR